MHIPPYYKKKEWQRFLAGVFIGGVMAYCVFLFMYGTHMERWIEENMELRGTISDLENQNSLLTQDKKELNDQKKKVIKVQDLEIVFLNEKKLLRQNKMDRLTVYKLRNLAKEQLPDVIGKDIKGLSDNASLLYTAIEAKTYTIDSLTYELKVERLIMTQNVVVMITIHPTT
ncbi:sporulation membrane protein YtrI [Pontibacillus litoralis]|uniref:Sporulation membrane protein YtrI C-terminal domain-containing protein n=1 Tax=Pontibacillus litoralis JSM 072002 TaxID=1385512 RepID=A0A0A5GAR7_9BACI|nr:sporulation membrane protein YtrI [Pontibacillus litoralis]KGX89104.1 hypothetical protein N784_01895 [Pontibacillus litoralis JSM 072002]